YSFSDPFVGFYLNDTWKARPNFTLTAGVREDFQIYPNQPGNPALPFTQKFHNQYRRVSPRVGFSYSPFSKTVVRGGAGVYYEIFVGGNYQNSTQGSGVASQQATLGLVDFSPATKATALPVVFSGALPSDSPLFGGGTDIVTIAPE